MRVTKKLIIALAAAVTLTGCATPKNFYAVGGSRADGTIDMAYDFAQFEKPVVNHQQAQSIAKSKCGVWGYGRAESFGGQTVNCQQRDGWGNCVAGQVLIKYQCQGNLDAPTSAAVVPAASFVPSAPAAAGSIPLSKEQWKQQQLDRLQGETGLSYEEYQRRYQQIMVQ